MSGKKLYRSKSKRVVAGVCGGLGDYFGIDPVMLRLILILIVIVSGFVPGVIGYIAAAIIIPEEGATKIYDQTPSTPPPSA